MAVRAVQTKIEFGSMSLIKCLGPTFSLSHLSCLINGSWRSFPGCPGIGFGSLLITSPQFFSAGLSRMKWQMKWGCRRWLYPHWAHPLPRQSLGHCSVWWKPLGHTEISPWNSCLCASVPKSEALLAGSGPGAAGWALECAQFLGSPVPQEDLWRKNSSLLLGRGHTEGRCLPGAPTSLPMFLSRVGVCAVPHIAFCPENSSLQSFDSSSLHT